MLTEIKAISGSIVVSIEFSSLPTDSDLQEVLDRVRSFFIVPRKSTLHHVLGIATIQVTLLPLGAVWLHTHSEYFDLFSCIEEFSPDGSAQGNIRIVGIRDQVPFDWSERVRRSLNSARHQLPKTSCNMVCIEVADLAYSRMPQELACIREGIDSFLRNDTLRVSGVILSISGLIPEGLRQYRSAGSAWLHVHENPYVPLPQSFVIPSFDQPRVSVRADIQRQAQE